MQTINKGYEETDCTGRAYDERAAHTDMFAQRVARCARHSTGDGLLRQKRAQSTTALGGSSSQPLASAVS